MLTVPPPDRPLPPEKKCRCFEIDMHLYKSNLKFYVFLVPVFVVLPGKDSTNEICFGEITS